MSPQVQRRRQRGTRKILSPATTLGPWTGAPTVKSSPGVESARAWDGSQGFRFSRVGEANGPKTGRGNTAAQTCGSPGLRLPHGTPTLPQSGKAAGEAMALSPGLLQELADLAGASRGAGRLWSGRLAGCLLPGELSWPSHRARAVPRSQCGLLWAQGKCFQGPHGVPEGLARDGSALPSPPHLIPTLRPWRGGLPHLGSHSRNLKLREWSIFPKATQPEACALA